MRKINRRIFVLAGLGAAGTAALPLRNALAASPYPFKLGVASGEPAPDSVVLWTRLAPSPLNADGQGGMANADVTVEWQVSTDERFGSLVAAGSVAARYADAHSVHVVAGGLAPDADYFYRFRAQGHISPVGRTRTAPAAGSFGRDLVMTFASCAHYESGYYTAYRRMAEDNPGLVLHLGDYLYEDATTTGSVREHAGAEIVSLADYRRRYAQYKSDPDLQAAHAAAPWLLVPDDHEVENNYAGTVRENNTPALTAAQWTARRTAAYRAYYENLPLRPSSAPSGNSIALYRRIRWGRLATFHMLDTRQYRDDQVCGDGRKVCADADLPGRTLTGAAQEAWLLDGLGQHLGTWDIMGQQVFFARQLDAAGAANMDSWDGYRASRSRIQQGWTQRGVRNPLVLTGDVHQAWANNLKADYANPGSATIGTELVCTSISSGGNGSADTAIPNGSVNPHIRFFSNRRGYVRTAIGRTQIRADFRAVTSVTEHGAPVSTAGSFVIADGRPGLQAG
ncbi:alkaline phosphatase D family protein [Plantactinospora sp. KLBMP9567]|uniref:alkaline phosphatase D family protein n=1 Tax=Plantactinospora sp. KLBMP9567 TaxID=3085900 RepID=UPI002981141B|nr:alkaline phosphatase D family protein [Plantactinospora sp. KLBMP9567]MDW5327434.1 alkaline phosphatase D family protein [Plantactinospora sp. KLBMP9567]